MNLPLPAGFDGLFFFDLDDIFAPGMGCSSPLVGIRLLTALTMAVNSELVNFHKKKLMVLYNNYYFLAPCCE